MDHYGRQLMKGDMDRRNFVISKTCLKGSHLMYTNKEVQGGSLCVVAGQQSHCDHRDMVV